MKKLTAFTLLLALSFLTACQSYIKVGEKGTRASPFVVAYDYIKKEYFFSPPPWCNEIRYDGFAFTYDKSDRNDFIIYTGQNASLQALWRTRKNFSATHTFFASAEKHKSPETEISLEQILDSMKPENADEESEYEILELDAYITKFKGIDAVFCRIKSYEERRDFYMTTEDYTFFIPPDSKYVMIVQWSERGLKNEIDDPEMRRLGEKFFDNFKLINE